jgi:hypothetical protein
VEVTLSLSVTWLLIPNWRPTIQAAATFRPDLRSL